MFCAKLLFLTVVFASLAHFHCQDAVDVESELYPDLSCHIGYPSPTNPRPDPESIYTGESELDSTLSDWFKLWEFNNDCGISATPGPNLPMIDDDYYGAWNLCLKFCVLDLLWITYSQYEEGVKWGKRAWSIANESFVFNEMNFKGQPGHGAKLSVKIQSECADIFDKVINIEKEPCNSERAEDVYNCINNALKC